MTPPTPSLELKNLRDWLQKRYGFLYPDEQLPLLAQRLKNALFELQASDLNQLLQKFHDQPETTGPKLLPALTIGETYFLRNQAQFMALRHLVLPQQIATLLPDQVLTLWSAGCASGEEAYSLAMWLREFAPTLWPKRIRIVATDINRLLLKKAKAARYGKHSFRSLEDHWRQRAFCSQDGKEFLVDPSLSQVISFQEHNLVSGLIPEGLAPNQLSVIFCRNVFIYLTKEAIAQALEMFERLLCPEGALFLGHAESTGTMGHWRAQYFPGTFYFQRPLPPNTQNPTPELPATKVAIPNSLLAPNLPTLATLPQQGLSEAAARSDQASSPTLLLQARRQADLGNSKKAQEILCEWLERHPASLEGQLLCAILAEQNNQWELAIATLKKVLFLDKNLVIGHYLLAILVERQGDKKQAISRYRNVCRLLEKVPKSVELPFADGLTAGRLWELAMAQLLELNDQAPKIPKGEDHEKHLQSAPGPF